MTDKAQNRKSGLILVLGGLLVGAITLGGYTTSKNPGWVSDMFKKPTNDVTVLDQTLTALDVCASVPVNIMADVCAKKDVTPVPSWANGLDVNERNCVRDSFRTTTFLEMDYRLEPKENFKDYDTDLGVIYFACGVVDEVADWLPDQNFDNAQNMLDKWYEARLAYMKSVQ